MKKLLIGIGIIIFLGLLLVPVYNGLVNKEENVEKMLADVQTQYQRRMDLIPNLVNTVKGYANFEKETLTQVIEARSKATSVNIDADNLTPENLQQFQNAQNGVSSALSRLLAVVESYPDLKANQGFADLRVQLEGTENRISVARRNFNGAVNEYNASLRRFPRNLIAGIFGFERKAYFQATPGAENAPTVQF